MIARLHRDTLMVRTFLHGTLLSAALALAGPALAQEAALLSVDGPDGSRSYDLPALQALGEVQIRTSTVWTEGVHGFTGVPLARILADAGIATGPGSTGDVSATAINDYAISIPLAEIGPDVPLVAYLMDDREMSVRDKGPLWIVYPYDADRQYQTEVIYSRSIWQLNRLSTAPVP